MFFLTVLACTGDPGPDPVEGDADTDTDSDSDTDVGEDIPRYSGTWEVPSQEDLKDLPLAPAEDGDGYTLIEGPEASLVSRIDQHTPVSAAADCAALIIACYSPGERNFPGCFENVVQCSTETPWEGEGFCCAPGCAGRYAELRADGLEPPDAAARAILDQGSCMPGYDAWEGE